MTETLKIHIPIYKTSLQVFFGSAEGCVEAQRKDNRVEEFITSWYRINQRRNDYDGAFSTDADDYNLIWLNDFPRKVKDYGALVHEIEHAVFYILTRKGLRHSDDSDEAFAYLMGYIYCEIDAFLSNKKEDEQK